MRSTIFGAAGVAAVMAAFAPMGPARAFELTSPDFDAGGPIPATFAYDGFGCTGGNVSPPLAWRDVPDGTASFALMVHDPDAPTGGAGFWHWIVLDIPGDARELPQGAGSTDPDAMPEGVRQVANDYGVAGWGGPCPPAADDPHRYDFTLYALPMARLEVPEGASKAVTGFVVNANAIDTATLQGTYDR